MLEEIDFRHPRGLDRARLQSLAHESRWVRLKQNVVLAGPTGIGKTYIACALAHKAYRDGCKALHTPAPQLFRDLRTSHAEGALPQAAGEAGAHRLPGGGRLRHESDERERAPGLFGDLQRAFRPALDAAGQPAAAAALARPGGRPDHGGQHSTADSILDRVLHIAHRFDLDGESLRKVQGQARLTAAAAGGE